MKKIVSFEKELDFPSMIGEVTSISLDHNLEFIDQNSIAGEFNIKGTYKMTEASTLEEDFRYDIPVDITLVESFDLSSVHLSIDNFYYEVVNDDILKCNIDLLIDGIEEVVVKEEEEEKEKKEEGLESLNEKIEPLDHIDQKEEVLEQLDLRECDGDSKEEKEIEVEQMEEEIAFKQIEEVKKLEGNTKSLEKVEQKEEIQEEPSKNISSLFEAFSDTEETFQTYSVYILRKDDTIENIMDQYQVTKEELSDYNDLSNLEVGSKLVIPKTTNE